MFSTKARKSIAVSSAVALGLTLAACGSGGTPTKAAATSAAKSPIPVGFVNMEKGALTFTDWGDGVRSAVSYINNDLGGVNGHPIHLDQCLTDGTPDASSTCATQLVGDHVAAVVDGIDLANAPLHPILDQAGIPMTGLIPFSPADYASKTSYWTGVGADYELAIPVLAEKVLHAASGVYLSPDTPDAAGPNALLQAVSAKIHFHLQIVKYSLTDPSLYGAAAAKAMSSHPDVIFVTGGDAQATPPVKALREGGWKGNLIAGNSQLFATQLPADQSTGTYTLSQFWQWDAISAAPASIRPELQAFSTAVKKYAPASTPDSFTQAGFASVMALYSVLKGITGSITPDTVKAGFAQDVQRHMFMGTTFDCAKPPTPTIAPGVCGSGVQLLKWDGHTWVENGDFESGTPDLG